MFYEDVKGAWVAGKVRIGLPAIGRLASDDCKVSVEASGLIGLKAKFLSRAERMKLVDLMKAEAGQLDRDLPLSIIGQWIDEGKAVLLTGRAGSGKSRLLAAALPGAVFVDGRTSDPSRPHWFWYQITKDPSLALVIDEPSAFPALVLDELLKVVRAQGRGYVVIGQAEEGSRFESLWRAMSSSPVGLPSRNFQWLRLSSFDGELARAKWIGSTNGNAKAVGEPAQTLGKPIPVIKTLGKPHEH